MKTERRISIKSSGGHISLLVHDGFQSLLVTLKFPCLWVCETLVGRNRSPVFMHSCMHPPEMQIVWKKYFVHSHSCLQAFIIPASRRRISFNVYVMISSFLQPDVLLANYKFSWLSIKLNVQNFQSVQRQHLKHCMHSHHPSALSLLAR